MKKPRLIIIRGAPATGKSTLARTLVDNFKKTDKTALLILDEFKWIMTAHEPRDKADFKISFNNYLFALKNYLNAGYTVVTEDTWFVHPRHKDTSTNLKKVITLARKHHAKTHLLFLKASLDTVKKYNNLRKMPVWETELKDVFPQINAQTFKNEHVITIDNKTPDAISKEALSILNGNC